MTTDDVIRTVLLGSIALTVFALGLSTSRRDVGYLFRDPGLLLRSLLSMNLVMPLVALALVAAFDLDPVLKVALIAIALAPVSPLVPKTALKAGGRDAYAVSLLFLTALLAVPMVPLGVHGVALLFGQAPEAPAAAAVAKAVLVTVLLPLTSGVVVRAVGPALAQRLVRPLRVFAGITLLLGVVPLLAVARSEIVSLIGNGTLLAIAGLVVASMVAGHLLAGRAWEGRAVLALSTASRHPAVAIVAASAADPGQRLTGAAILLYVLTSLVAARLYVVWGKRRRRATLG